MTSYKVAHTSYGITTEKWFSTKEDTKRYARSIIKLGYAPSVLTYEEDTYSKPKSAIFPSLVIAQFFGGVLA